MMDFMESLRRGVDRAGFEMDRMLRANRVRSQINALRAQRDDEVLGIGRQVLEMFQRGDPIPEGLQVACERVRQVNREIREREAELDAINQESPASEEQSGSWTAEERAPAGEPAVERCPYCGATVPANASFCPSCGTNLKAKPQGPAGPSGPATQRTEERPTTTDTTGDDLAV